MKIEQTHDIEMRTHNICQKSVIVRVWFLYSVLPAKH